MKDAMLKKLDGYDEIIHEIRSEQKYGSDFSDQKGAVKCYINRLHPDTIALRIADIIPETPTTKTIRLVSADGYLPPFQAGQYLSLFVEVDSIKTTRPYSISSSPTERGYWDITIRRVENGLVSNYLLDSVLVDDTLTASGPQGQFCYNPLFHDDVMVCLAGGSGVTPFLSMIRELTGKLLERTLFLFYGSKIEEELICHSELVSLADKHPNFTYIPIVEQPGKAYTGMTGVITADALTGVCNGMDGKTVYICGPQAMYDFCLRQLEILNVSQRKIRKEMYGVPLNIWEVEGWPKDVSRDKTVTVCFNGKEIGQTKSSTPLLSLLERAGYSVPSTCRCGECSMCRVRLLKGKVFQPPGALVRKSDRRFGFIHSCASYPLTDVDLDF